MNNIVGSLTFRWIGPYILSADHSALAENIQICYNNDVKWIHVDICDGVATSGSLTFGPKHVADLKQKFPTLGFDVHVSIMIDMCLCYFYEYIRNSYVCNQYFVVFIYYTI